MAKIVWTRKALNDLKKIYNYIGEDSPFYAARYTNKLFNKVEILETFPESGKMVPEKNDPNIRELIEGNYRIFYKYKPQKNIAILRIHHSAKLLR